MCKVLSGMRDAYRGIIQNLPPLRDAEEGVIGALAGDGPADTPLLVARCEEVRGAWQTLSRFLPLFRRIEPGGESALCEEAMQLVHLVDLIMNCLIPLDKFDQLAKACAAEPRDENALATIRIELLTMHKFKQQMYTALHNSLLNCDV